MTEKEGKETKRTEEKYNFENPKCRKCGKIKYRSSFDTVDSDNMGYCRLCHTLCSWCGKKKPRRNFKILDNAFEGNVCKKCWSEYHGI